MSFPPSAVKVKVRPLHLETSELLGYKNTMPLGAKPAASPLLSVSRLTFAIVMLTVALRLAAMIALGTAVKPESFESARIAENVFAGKGFVFNYGYIDEELRPTSYMAPAYVYLLVPFLALGTGAAFGVAVQAAHALLAGVTSLLLVRMGNREFGRPVGFVAGGFYAFHLPAMVMSTRVHEINLTVPLVVWLVHEITNARTHCSWKQAIRLGGVMGTALLAEPSYAIFCAAAFVYLLIGADYPPAARIRRLSVAGLACVLVLAPWTIRNVLVHKKFVFVKSVAGLNLWFGNNPRATGSDSLAPQSPGSARAYMLRAMDPQLEQQVREAPTEMDKERIFGRAAVQHIRSHPGRTLRLALHKATMLWWRDEIHPLGRLAAYQAWQIALFLTGLTGLVLGFRRNSGFCLLAGLLLACQTAVYMVFCVLPRYRMMQDPILIVGAAYLTTLVLPQALRRNS